MSRDLPSLVSQVFNTPHLLQGKKLQTILDAIGARLLSGQPIEATAERPEREARGGGSTAGNFEHGGYLADGGIAVLPVYGTLVRRGSWLDAMSGMASYQRIEAAVIEMAESPAVRGIMLDIDSFGGQASGCFDLVSSIAEISRVNEKPMWAIANEAAASAAFAIASAADKIWIPQMGVVGSVGVVAAHVDVTKADQMAGQKWTFIYAGERKIDGNPHIPLSDEAKAEEQDDIDDLYASFVDLVAANRRMSAEAVRDTQARVYRGQKAIDVGFADELGTLAEAMQAFAEYLDETPSTATRRFAVDQQRTYVMSRTQRGKPQANANATADIEEDRTLDNQTSEGTGEGDDEGEGEADAPAAAPTATAPKRQPAAAAPQSLDAAALETQRCSELASLSAQAAKMGVSFDLAKAISGRVSVDAARKSILDAAAEADEAIETHNLSTSHTVREGNTTDAVTAGYNRAIERVSQRFGFKR
ncbi:hypothetical protein BA190_09410 [Labrys sp. WJW]|uniref:S49 family peptidase n=1 Tax=Labrys sp. WJW TaxID=1737983 RepID=UPI000835264B|nr:S49 family peptidase [Labrys sp. WJW]OCC05123.1 hypothetical protein BA190_09410 [Labrys sp. WJW]